MSGATDLYIGSLIAVQLLFGAGYFLNRFTLPDLDRGYHFILALPAGILLWGILWSLTSLVFFDYMFGFSSLTNQIALVLFFLIFLFVFLKSVFYLRLERDEIIHIGLWSGTYIILSLLFLFNGYIVISGDSYVFINWAQDPLITLQRGFPLILVSIANLSTLISADYYLFILHPLITISLILLIGQLALSLIRKYGHSYKPEFFYLLLLLLLFIFSMNPMMFMNMIYINGHVLFATSVTALIAILSVSDRFDWRKIVMIVLLSLGITMLRMEGFLILLPLFALTLFGKERVQNLKIAGSAITCCTLYLLFLVVHFRDSGFVNGGQYLVMILLAFILLILITNRFVAEKIGSKTLWILALVSGVLLFIFMVLTRPDVMTESIYAYIRNLATPGAWGSVIVISAFLLTIAFIYRFKEGLKIYDHDLFLVLFLLFAVMILMLGYFRNPFRLGRFDSANRMFFHYIPLLIIWISIEFNRIYQIIRYKNSSD